MENKRWMWIDWLIFSLRCGWYGTGLTYYYVNSESLGELSYGWFAFFVSLGFLIPLIFWRPGYVNSTFYALTELVVSGGFSLYINNILGISLSDSIILMPILMIGYLMTKKTAPWTVPLFVFLLPANRYWTIDTTFNFFIQYVDILIFFVFGLGFNLITKSQKRYKQLLFENMQQYKLIQQQNEALEQYASQVEKIALLEERNRMARDLHDSIGHHFTSVIVGLDAITYMIESHPNLAAEKLASLADVARTGLTEVRRTIHQIAPSDENLPLSHHIEKLANEFGTHTNTEVEIRVEGSEPPVVLTHQKLALVRCLQECMTNAKRHGNAERIRILLQFLEEEILLTVYNDGLKMEIERFGFGLTSMKNRLEELNGLLKVENEEAGGVTVTGTLPLRR